MKLLSAAPASFFSAASDLQLANAGAEIRQIATASVTTFIGTSLKPVFCRCRLDVRIAPKSGHVVAFRDGRFVPILLQKSFCTRGQNFFWLSRRLPCKYVGDLIVRRKTRWRPRQRD